MLYVRVFPSPRNTGYYDMHYKLRTIKQTHIIKIHIHLAWRLEDSAVKSRFCSKNPK